MVPIISIVGYSNTGKTAILEGLIRILKERGHRVAAVKHAAHGYNIDLPGKDSWRYYEAGADKVVVVGPTSFTIHERCLDQPRLKEIYKEIEGVDFIIVEGFKGEPGPKIEVFQKDCSPARLSLGEDLVAVVSDIPLADNVPCFSFDEVEALADFLVNWLNR